MVVRIIRIIAFFEFILPYFSPVWLSCDCLGISPCSAAASVRISWRRSMLGNLYGRDFPLDRAFASYEVFFFASAHGAPEKAPTGPHLG